MYATVNWLFKVCYSINNGANEAQRNDMVRGTADCRGIIVQTCRLSARQKQVLLDSGQ